MNVPRHHTIGAVARDLGTLKALEERLEEIGVSSDSLAVLTRRRDEAVVRNVVTEARVRKVEAGLTRMQWFEFASTYLGVTAVSVLMGAVHLPTGIIVQTVMTLAAVIGLVIYHRQPRLERKLLGMGLPEKLAGEWQSAFPGGFALALVTVREEDFDEAQSVFLEDSDLESPLAVDQRPVF